MSPFTALGLAAAAFVAGGVNAVAGGGSLLSFPALLAAGYGALTANVTNTVALLPGYLGGSLAYREQLRGQGARARGLAGVSIAGALGGTVLLLTTSQSTFQRVVPWLILAGVVLIALQPRIGAWVQRRTQHRHAERPVPLLAAQLVGAVYGAYFGAGLGVIMLALLAIFLDDSLQRLNALKGVLSLLINGIAAIGFLIFGSVAFLPLLVMLPSAYAGGQLGVVVARRLDPNVLRGVVVVVGAVAAVRLMVR